MLVIAPNLHLGHHLERDPIVLGTEFPDFTRGSRLLAAELIAGEAEDDELLTAVLLVQGLELLVLGSVAAAAGGVHDEDPLALELGEVERLAIEGRGGQGMEVGHGNGEGITGFGSAQDGSFVGAERGEAHEGKGGEGDGHDGALHETGTRKRRASSENHPSRKEKRPDRAGRFMAIGRNPIMQFHSCRTSVSPSSTPKADLRFHSGANCRAGILRFHAGLTLPYSRIKRENTNRPEPVCCHVHDP